MAVGDAAVASGFHSTAVGGEAVASGRGAQAFGWQSSATGDLALAAGHQASASGTQATAIGKNAAASAANSTAVGFGATAAFANSTAIGTGAATTAANQITLGAAGTTVRFGGYSTAGVLVNDVNGIVSTNTTLIPQVAANTAAIGTLQGNVTTLQNNVTTLFDLSEVNRRDIRKANEGVAMALAMETPHLPAGTSMGVAGGIGYYQNRLAGTASFAARVGANASFSAGLGLGFDSGEIGARAGFSTAW